MGININVTSNTFYKWPSAITVNWDEWGESIVPLSTIVTYNEFIQNTIAIDLDTAYQQRINYNNFIQNTWYNIRSRNDEDQAYCNYNWNGDVANITHPHLIAAKIRDGCDTDLYDGIVTFWPYFEAALDFTNLEELPVTYGFDFVNCSSMNDTIAHSPTTNPTTQPTANPTMRPTDDSIFTKISLSKLYMFVGNNPLSFFEAWRYCQDEYNTTLAQIHNEQQNQEMYSLV
eukprot:930907_1